MHVYESFSQISPPVGRSCIESKRSTEFCYCQRGLVAGTLLFQFVYPVPRKLVRTKPGGANQTCLPHVVGEQYSTIFQLHYIAIARVQSRMRMVL